MKRRLRKKPLFVLGLALVVIAVAVIWRGQARRFPRGIVIHHSAGQMWEGGRAVGAEDIDRWHAERGFRTVFEEKTYHIGYHYVIRGDGKIEAGLPEKCWGSHAKRGNDRLGICVIGDFSSRDNRLGAKGPVRPTPEQMRSLLDLCRSLLARRHLPVSSIRTHRQVDGDTECPGDRFPLAELLAGLRAAPREGRGR